MFRVNSSAEHCSTQQQYNRRSQKNLSLPQVSCKLLWAPSFQQQTSTKRTIWQKLALTYVFYYCYHHRLCYITLDLLPRMHSLSSQTTFMATHWQFLEALGHSMGPTHSWNTDIIAVIPRCVNFLGIPVVLFIPFHSIPFRSGFY